MENYSQEKKYYITHLSILHDSILAQLEVNSKYFDSNQLKDFLTWSTPCPYPSKVKQIDA